MIMESSIIKMATSNNFEREKLREKGQFWTPDWVAEAMVSYVTQSSTFVFDPAFGRGAFYNTLKNSLGREWRHFSFYGIDIDKGLVDAAKDEHLINPDFFVEERDFILNPPQRRFKSIVANPPYIRHHRLSKHIKDTIKTLSLNALGKALDGRAGIHIYFLIQALLLLEKGGKLAFIMPSDTCEGIFCNDLWKWVTENYCLECVITFKPNATPFPDVDTNAVIFLIQNKQQTNNILWVQVNKPNTSDLNTFIKSNFQEQNLQSLRVLSRSLDEALTTGISRDPVFRVLSKYTLHNFAYVMRGIATGANDFFFMTQKEAKQRNLPSEFFKKAIGRTRDISEKYLTYETIQSLEEKGRPTLLLSLDSKHISEFPKSIQDYIKLGNEMGLPNKSLISTRKPWYKMEQRKPPPFLFAYLGRRNMRFIRNAVNVLPLTGFLCVYSKSNDPDYIENLWALLQHPETIQNLKLIGKTYGSGAIKIEPRALEKLPIPDHLVDKYFHDVNT